ncbi:MAG: PAS domain-containing protein [Acidiferrobacterales bacterium]|nr:PAS domain-containing protein [Acidiferrobacterales bacterium]
MTSQNITNAPKLVKHTSRDAAMDRPDFFATGIINVKASSEIVSANNIATELLGFPEEFEFRGKNFLEVCSSLGTESWSELLAELEQNKACEFGAVFLNYVGDYVELNCLAVFELGASVMDIYLSDTDEQGGKYDAVFRKLEICESFLETDLMDINIKNTDMEYEVTSGLFEKTFSLESGGAVGKTPFDIYPPAFADHVTSHDQMVLDRKQVVTQIDVVPYSGKHLLVQKFPLFRNNSVSGIGVFAVDVTSLKDTERRLLDSKNKYSDYVDLCEDILWEADGDWLLRESNVADVPNISGIELKNGENFLSAIKANLSNSSEFEIFVNSLGKNEILKQVFELKNGFRIRLGIKACTMATGINGMADSHEDVFYRGIITILRGS